MREKVGLGWGGPTADKRFEGGMERKKEGRIEVWIQPSLQQYLGFSGSLLRFTRSMASAASRDRLSLLLLRSLSLFASASIPAVAPPRHPLVHARGAIAQDTMPFFRSRRDEKYFSGARATTASKNSPARIFLRGRRSHGRAPSSSCVGLLRQPTGPTKQCDHAI